MPLNRIDQLILRIWLICILAVGLVSPVFVHRPYVLIISPLSGCSLAALAYWRFGPKRARSLNWLVFGLSLLVSGAAFVGLAVLLIHSGGCPRQVTTCGAPDRRASFIFLGLGVLLLANAVLTFIRSPDEFR